MGLTLTPQQEEIIATQPQQGLVLAPPGCGKTFLLALRVVEARRRGIAYGDMLCLTFTNRAAREMTERIALYLPDSDSEAMYVGNVHRFCSQFLISHGVLAADMSIIDDDDALSILAQCLNEDEVMLTPRKRQRQCQDAMHLAAFMHQLEQGHPKSLRTHPDCLCGDDRAALKLICATQGYEFTAETMLLLYRQAEDYKDIVTADAYPTSSLPALFALLNKMTLARQYDAYKRENHLLDFEDLLLFTYDYLCSHDDIHRYAWCQVDEVQDLNPLQLSIIDHLLLPGTAERPTTTMFFGDEQQAIFSFMGAKLDTLQQLKSRCEGNIYYLDVNHRSPNYLVEMFNIYAREVLHLPERLLPSAVNDSITAGDERCILCSNDVNNEFSDAAQQAQRLANQNPAETVAVLVNANKDAEQLSDRMTELHIDHFKVSGNDLFNTPQVKLLLSHLAIFAAEQNLLAWARILTGVHIYERNAAARDFVQQLFIHAMTPLDLLLRPDSSYVEWFVGVYESCELVVFDTETTGLDAYHDDIIQIAAVKLRRGEIVPGSQFCVHITTEQAIPTMLGDIVNPILAEREAHTLVAPSTALAEFMDYIGSDILIAHNADFDYTILGENLRRYAPEYDLAGQVPQYLDTLRLCRLLFPDLTQYKLKSLLETFHLEGENSHLADDDVEATCNVVTLCYDKSIDLLPSQKEFLQQRSVRERAERIRTVYLPLYRATASRLRRRQDDYDVCLLADELQRFYSYLVRIEMISPVATIHYLFRYVTQVLGKDGKGNATLLAQIRNHLNELASISESDLYLQHVVTERIIISTIHKAKGLAFDNVILFDVCADRFPSAFAKDNPALAAEDARKIYVAITRAKHRVLLTLSAEKRDYHNCPVKRATSPFILPLLPLLTPPPPVTENEA